MTDPKIKYLLIILIILCLGILAVFSYPYLFDTHNVNVELTLKMTTTNENLNESVVLDNNVDAIVQLQGSDIVVTIIGGNGAYNITGLRAYIEGRESNAITKHSITVGEPVYFKDLARDVSGTSLLVVEGIFNDGTKDEITVSRMKFS